jgi:hypothetical protein
MTPKFKTSETMELDTQTLMMIFFVLFLIISIWKISAFLPNKVLADDDTTEVSHAQLLRIMLKVIKNSENIDEKKLFELMREDDEFDKKHFWRFNQNKLKHLLNQYYLENAGLNSIEDIHKNSKV